VTRSLPAQLVLKESRALAPIWFAVIVTILLSGKAGQPVLGLLAFVLGTVALGAYSVGHEYAHRTLTTLLAQPLSRSRLLLAKGVVLALLLAVLAVVAQQALLAGDALDVLIRGRLVDEPLLGSTGEGAARWRLAIVFLAPVLGLCIAPWLTMLSRSALAGLVFTLAVPAVLFIAGQIARVATVGFAIDPLAYGPALTLMIVGLLAISVVAVVNGRSRFVHLEALDAPHDMTPSVRKVFPKATAAVQSQRHHPVVILVQKELRLHLLACVVAGLYAVVWIAMRLTRMDAYIAGQSFEAISGLYGIIIATLAGAVASADERALGTSDWQVLQPWAHWKQWTVKIATVVTVAMALGLLVPIALEALFPLIGDAGHAGLRNLSRLLFFYVGYGYGAPLGIPFVSVFAAYVSTFCSSGLRALLVSLPLSVGLSQLFFQLWYAAYSVEQMMLRERYGESPFPFLWRLPTVTPGDIQLVALTERWSSTLALAGFVVLTIVLALRNSRSAERGPSLARRQLPWVLVYVSLAGILVHAVPATLKWWLFTH